MDYSKTLNLPQTDFPMKANLPAREPQILEFWEKNRIYRQLSQKNNGKPKRILHDGPPYSNGRIHLGHAVNKIVKDIVVKFWMLMGYDSPYVPGWDTHGLPNELEAIKTFKLDRKAIQPMELRKKCRESALHFVDIQREQFKRLGILGDWEHPYLTLDPLYEAAIVGAFGVMAQNGYVYRGKKSVHWCYTCETALADAEIEYANKTSPSIYVRFPVKKGKLLEQNKKNVYVLIWTTTPWTLPGNVAIALHPDEMYVLADTPDGDSYLLAEKLLPQVEKALGKTLKPTSKWQGQEIAEGSSCQHPFLDRESVLICQDYVTMEDGTGCVHTAPGHGAEDFEAAKLFNLPIPVPVNERGVLTEEAGPFKGLHIEQANVKIPEFLKEKGFLPASGTIQHSYPHCWRCHKPVIFRATEQWFVSVEHNDLRKKAAASVKSVKWFPAWGEERMRNTVGERPDWCISRQRVWGVPIPVFYCEACQKPIHTKESIESVKQHFSKEGADSWFMRAAADLLPKNFACPHCRSTKEFRKEMDIFDVWFESGVSHLGVLETRRELQWPAQLYLEGPDQYRGWFQSSLLAALMVKAAPPYKEVVTNGWTLDLEGRAMHKSLGNVIDPMDVLKDYGADILRLFFSSVDFKSDFRIGDKVLKDVGEAYRKIRNTFRFLLGNLFDFDPQKHTVPYAKLTELDRWILMELLELTEKVQESYENYDFHLVVYHVLNFCVVQLSAVYFDVLKDRLYTLGADSLKRRSSQTALYAVWATLTRILFPVLSFTAEEVWLAAPGSFRHQDSVAFSEWPSFPKEYQGEEALKNRWKKILEIKNEIYAALEGMRQEKIIRQSLEAAVKLALPEEEYTMLHTDTDLLQELFIVSKLDLEKAADSKRTVVTEKAPGEKCARCWRYYAQLSSNAEFPDICDRCLEVLAAGAAAPPRS